MKIELLPLVPSDFPKLISWAVSEDFLLQWTGRTFTYPLDEAQLEKYYKPSTAYNTARRILKAIDPLNSKHIGNITIDWTKTQQNEAVLACIIVGDADYHGKGVGEQIVNEACRIAFNELGKKKVFLNVFDFNTAAIRCYEKCGFKQVFRGKLIINGKEYVNVRMEKISLKS
ncbi:MAG TPA: GNAT family protein [Ignavibacteria bacterium]